MKKENKLTSKLLIELFLVPIAISYIYYLILNNHTKASLVIMSIIIFFTCLEFAIKYIKEVIIYENKNNLFKIIYSVFSILLIIITVLNLFINNNIIAITFKTGTIILLIYLLYYIIINIKGVMNNTKEFSKTIVISFISLIAFCLILTSFFITFEII